MMRNRYPGTCYRCHKRVKAGEGHFEMVPYNQRTNNQRWRIQHAQCAIEYRGTDKGKEHADLAFKQRVGQ